MAENLFTEIKVPQQKTFDGDLFPTVLSPKLGGAIANSHDVSVFTEAIRAYKPWLQSLLLKSGAIFFRGFPVATASDFNDVVEAFGFEELPYIGGAAPRSKVIGRVSTANESPLDQKIPFHHELAQVPKFPSKLFFFCEIAPAKGGETPIVLSHIIYQRMKEKYPEFVERLEKHGLIYTKVLGEDDDHTSTVGRGWKSTFLTQERSVAEERAADLGLRMEWEEDGGVKTIMGPIPAIRTDESRQRKVWLNSIVIAYTSWGDARNDPVKAITFGDGKPLPADIIYDCAKILDDESVAIPWQKGDFLLLDNWAVLHSRLPSHTPRRILASLCK
ncbi:hypothetical protein U1Q18_006526 [Sarracenia purpurea var. burkii]